MIVEHFPVGALQCNCTILGDPATGDAIVIDGGADAAGIYARLAAHGLRARYLVHTHAHLDHVGALAELKEATAADGLLHPEDLPLYATLGEQARWMGVPRPREVAFDADLRDGDTIRAGNLALHVHHTPGHTPGSVSFALDREGATLLLTGDTLFRGSIGRWDLGGTSMEDIVTSIRGQLLPYADETVVVPGHGPFTTIGAERRSNPYLL